VTHENQQPRLTLATLKVLKVLVEHPSSLLYGLDLSRQVGLPPGTIYPILTRLEQAGWIRSSWEQADPSDLGRPRRRLYQLTSDGAERAASVLEESRQAIQPDRPSRRGLRRPRPWGSPA